MCINLIKPDIAARMVIMMVGVYYQTGQIRQFLYNCMYISCTNAFIERQLDREEYNGEASVADTISYLHEYRVNPIEEGKVFDLGGRKLEVIETF